MSDDQKALADELDRLAAEHAKLSADATRPATSVRQIGRIGDALDELHNGGFSPDEAGKIAGGNYMRMFR
jgi:hypothetical protein